MARRIAPARLEGRDDRVLRRDGSAGPQALAALRTRARSAGGLFRRHVHDSPRRAHSVCAQGGINAAKPSNKSEAESINNLFVGSLKRIEILSTILHENLETYFFNFYL